MGDALLGCKDVQYPNVETWAQPPQQGIPQGGCGYLHVASMTIVSKYVSHPNTWNNDREEG
jgi:hypothetical protein